MKFGASTNNKDLANALRALKHELQAINKLSEDVIAVDSDDCALLDEAATRIEELDDH